jgi:hypothetical protein
MIMGVYRCIFTAVDWRSNECSVVLIMAIRQRDDVRPLSRVRVGGFVEMTCILIPSAPAFRKFRASNSAEIAERPVRIWQARSCSASTMGKSKQLEAERRG